MPILEDIMDHDLFGPKIREGIAIGKREGQREILRSLIEKRFRAVPRWAEERLESFTPEALQAAALRVLDAASIEDVLK